MFDEIKVLETKVFDRPVLCVYVADTHGGSSVGTFPDGEVFYTDDGGELEPSYEQTVLWKFIQSIIDKIARFKRHNPNCIIRIYFTGDLVEGFHHGSTQTMTTSEVTMENIGFEIARRFVDVCDEFVVIRGTEDHVGPSAAMEERIALRLAGMFPTKILTEVKYRKTWWVWEDSINGALTNITHHGNVGRSFENRLNPLIRKIKEMAMDRKVMHNQPLPNLMISGHAHISADTLTLFPNIRVLQLPCLKMGDGYGHKVCTNKKPDIGIWASYHQINGEFDIIKHDFYKFVEDQHIEF